LAELSAEQAKEAEALAAMPRKNGQGSGAEGRLDSQSNRQPNLFLFLVTVTIAALLRIHP